jgi:hypothetical protein
MQKYHIAHSQASPTPLRSALLPPPAAPRSRRDEAHTGEPGDMERHGASGVTVRLRRRIHLCNVHRFRLLQLQRFLVRAFLQCSSPGLLAAGLAVCSDEFLDFLVSVILSWRIYFSAVSVSLGSVTLFNHVLMNMSFTRFPKFKLLLWLESLFYCTR